MDEKEKENEVLAQMAGIAEDDLLDTRPAQCDEFRDFITLLYRVNEFQPQDKWIEAILKSDSCKKFKNLLLAVVEDYEKQ